MCRVLCALEWHIMYKELWQENVDLCLLLLSVLYVWLSQLHWVPLSWLSKHIWEGIQCFINYYFIYTPSIWMIKLHLPIVCVENENKPSVIMMDWPTINFVFDYLVQMVLTYITLNIVLKTYIKVWNRLKCELKCLTFIRYWYAWLHLILPFSHLVMMIPFCQCVCLCFTCLELY